MPPIEIVYVVFYLLGVITVMALQAAWLAYSNFSAEATNCDLMSRAEKIASQQYEMWKAGYKPELPIPPIEKQSGVKKP